MDNYKLYSGSKQTASKPYRFHPNDLDEFTKNLKVGNMRKLEICESCQKIKKCENCVKCEICKDKPKCENCLKCTMCINCKECKEIQQFILWLTSKENYGDTFIEYFKNIRKFEGNTIEAAIYLCVIVTYFEKLFDMKYVLYKGNNTQIFRDTFGDDNRSTHLLKNDFREIEKDLTCVKIDDLTSRQDFYDKQKTTLVKLLTELINIRDKTRYKDNPLKIENYQNLADVLGIDIVLYKPPHRIKIKCNSAIIVNPAKIEILNIGNEFWGLHRIPFNPIDYMNICNKYISDCEKIKVETLKKQAELEEQKTKEKTLQEAIKIEEEEFNKEEQKNEEARKIYIGQIEENEKLLQKFTDLIESDSILLKTITELKINSGNKIDEYIEGLNIIIEKQQKLKDEEQKNTTSMKWDDNKRCRHCKEKYRKAAECPKTRVLMKFSTCDKECKIKLCEKCLFEKLRKLKEKGKISVCFNCYENYDKSYIEDLIRNNS